MTFQSSYAREWFSNIRGEVLSCIVVALALIPEAIGFSVIAGLIPRLASLPLLRLPVSPPSQGGAVRQ